MKRTLLAISALTVAIGVCAQTQQQNRFPHASDATAKRSLSDVIHGNEQSMGAQQHVMQSNPYQGMYNAAKAAIDPPSAQAVTETQIGTTTYDLQSNSAVQNRLERHAGGTMAAVWTYSNSGDLGATDRGTGYNYFNGTSWGAVPTIRLESDRNGWPSIGHTSPGSEIATCHNTAASVGTINSRTAIGSGAWTQANYTSNYQIWTRMSIGGANGQTIHQVSLRDPGTPYSGVEGHMLYYRSTDGGSTWGISDQIIPGLDNTNFAFMSGDSYSFSNSKGDTVAFCYYGGLNDVVMAKTTDNGANWNLTTIVDAFPGGVIFDPNSANTSGSPIGISDVTGDQVADTIDCSDGTGSIMIDRNGMVHVVYGAMRYLDDTPGDGQWSYFPGTNGLMYWNENMGANNPGVMITGALDIDGNGGIDIVGGDPIAGIGTYFTSMSSFPSLSLAGADTIYMAYSAIHELLNTGVQTYRHEYVMMSPDGGCTWYDPIDVTGDPAHDFDECVFGSLSRWTDDGNVHMVYQFDTEPGLAVRGDNDPFQTNQINYLTAPAADFVSALPFSCVSWAAADFPNICIGDTAIITASCGSAYSWSTGSTTDTIMVMAPGTYTVTITTACGTDVVPVTVGAGQAPVANVTANTTAICPGDTAWLTADPVAGGTYAWSSGGTAQTEPVTAAGTYTVTVTNCVGTDNASIVITAETVPTLDSITTSGSPQSFCDGAGPVTMTVANASGNVTGYQWYLNGTPIPAPIGTGSFISVNSVAESGNYTCTVYNNCGDSAVSAAIAITVNPLPAAPTCTYDAATNTWTNGATGVSYQWYAGPQGSGTPIPGETGASITDASWQTHDGQNVYVVITDANGCSNECQGIVTVDEISLANAMSIYPNPNNGEFTLSFAGAATDLYTVEVKNVLGQVISSDAYSISGNINLDLDLRDAEKGVYFITITNSDSKHTEKVVIK